MTTQIRDQDLCTCGHEGGQHVRSGPRKGVCLAGINLHWCRCCSFVHHEVPVVGSVRVPIEAVYLDMDGVLADFVTGAVVALGRNPDEVLAKVTPGDYDGIYTALGMAENEFWERIDALAGGHAPGAGLWGDLAPYPWRDAVLAACRKVAPTWILTSPSRSPGSSFGKVSWLQAWLGVSFRDYILTPRKWHVARPGTLLIDDSDRNVKKWRQHGGTAILFPRLWNSAHELDENPLDVLSKELAKLEPCTGFSARPS